MTLENIEPGTEIVAEELEGNFSYLNTFITSVRTSVSALNDSFDGSTGHKHTGVTGQAPKIEHHNLSGLTDDDHSQYVLADGTRSMSELTVVGQISGRREILQPASSMGTTPIHWVKSHDGTTVFSVLEDGTVNIVANGTYNIDGVDILSTNNTQYITLCFGNVADSEAGRMKSFYLPVDLGGVTIHGVYAVAYQVLTAATPVTDYVNLDIFRNATPVKNVVWDEVFDTLTLNAGSYVEDSWVPATPEEVVEDQYIGVELETVSDAGATDITVTFVVSTPRV